MTRYRVALVLAAAAAIVACADAPSPVLPADAALDGGHTLGSGGGTPPATAPGDAVAGDSAGRGGHTLGSGG